MSDNNLILAFLIIISVLLGILVLDNVSAPQEPIPPDTANVGEACDATEYVERVGFRKIRVHGIYTTPPDTLEGPCSAVDLIDYVTTYHYEKDSEDGVDVIFTRTSTE